MGGGQSQSQYPVRPPLHGTGEEFSFVGPRTWQQYPANYYAQNFTRRETGVIDMSKYPQERTWRHYPDYVYDQLAGTQPRAKEVTRRRLTFTHPLPAALPPRAALRGLQDATQGGQQGVTQGGQQGTSQGDQYGNIQRGPQAAARRGEGPAQNVGGPGTGGPEELGQEGEEEMGEEEGDFGLQTGAQPPPALGPPRSLQGTTQAPNRQTTLRG